MEKILNETMQHAQIVKMQFAADSLWEECLAVEKDAVDARAKNWFAALAAQYLAIEVFLDLCHEGSCPVFAGVRVPASFENVAAAQELVAAWQGQASFTLADFLQYLDEKMGLTELFSGEPDFMELGVLNLWDSFGPLRFWECGCAGCREAFYKALSGAGRFKSFLPAAAAIESAFFNPAPHWLGYPVTKQFSDGHTLSFDIIETFFEGKE